MFERIVAASEALGKGARTLMPALSTCPRCESVAMIAGPAMPRCQTCGVEHADYRHPASGR